ncbi:MAG: 2-oxo acid dehydrogenase subunit E2 [Candidatus Brocadiaceae bacterium]|nr:2-oxo acid dehydrogenase subunit E2 [Candidatus Brocadiaceae bacterium]
MLEPVHLPQLGQTMTEGTVAKWHKQEGEHVAKGEILYDLTTDKATLEVPAFASGVVKTILVPEGSTRPVGELIAVLGEESDDLPADLDSLRGHGPAAPAAEARAEGGRSAPASAPPPAGAAASGGGGRAFASPRARKVAGELGVPLGVVAGSGPGGRVVEADVRAYAARRADVPHTPAAAAVARERGVDLVAVAEGLRGRRVRKADVQAAAPSAVAALGGADGERVALSPMRRTIAARMAQSKQTVPHFYLLGEVEMRAAMAYLAARAEGGVRVTLTVLIVRAIGEALCRHPRVNARFDRDAVVLNGACNVGVAVAVEDGLFVPVIRDADAKDLETISAELKTLAGKARAGALLPEDYEGGSVTLSNLGMYGVDGFLPIINPPEACIVGVGTVRERVIARGGRPVVEPTMEVSVSADHRVVDGAEAGRFFQTLKGLLEHPGGPDERG